MSCDDIHFLNVCEQISAEGPGLRHVEPGENAVQSVRREAVCASKLCACCMLGAKKG